MTLTAQLGTANSMPGNLALGTLPPTGNGTGGTPPAASASAATPSGSASAATPTASAVALKPN